MNDTNGMEWNNFCVISLKAYTKKTKNSKFYSEIPYFFQLSFFSDQKDINLKGELNKFFGFEFLLRMRYLAFKITQKSSL